MGAYQKTEPLRIPERMVKVEEAIVQVQSCIAEVGDATLGTRRSEFAGGGREEDGLIHRARRTEADMETVKEELQEVRRLMSNGGPRRRLNTKERITLWTAIAGATITAVGMVIAAAVGAFT